ncbi:hypothetical protein MTO96_007147 [Rhipicephalus appendiculatus]
MAAGPAKAAAAAKKPVLVELDMDFRDGGSSPWFNSKGRSVLAAFTTDPANADLFSELALDGTMAGLTGYLDTEQPTLGRVALFCYVLLGLVLLELLLVLPLCAYALRRYASSVGVLPWLACEIVFLGSAGVQVVTLLSLFSTWNGMKDGLDDKTPQAYAWTFQLLLNYTQLTALQLKEAKNPAAKDIDKALALTTNSIKWLQGNLSAWENSFSGYDNLKRMVTGPLAIVHMAVLGIAVAVAVAAALLACGAWSRRKRNLNAGGKSPVFVGLILMCGTVLLLVHMLIALPMVARWLNVCVLAETYLCAPYRAGSYAILDDSVARVWPLASRPEPFCRLVPSAVRPKCAAKATTSITALKACPAVKKGKALQSDVAIEESQVLIWQKPPKPLPKPPAKAKIIGDCFYPYKIIDTDMTAACPLFTDELVGHWMALLIAAIFGMISSFTAGLITVIFLAVGQKKKEGSQEDCAQETRQEKEEEKEKEAGGTVQPAIAPVIRRPRHRRRRRRPLMPPPIFVLPLPPPTPPVQCTHQWTPRTALPMLAAPVGAYHPHPPLPQVAASAPACPSTVVMSSSESVYQQQAAASYTNLDGGGAGTWQGYSAYNSSASSRTVTPATTVRTMSAPRVETANFRGPQPVVTRYCRRRPLPQPPT